MYSSPCLVEEISHILFSFLSFVGRIPYPSHLFIYLFFIINISFVFNKKKKKKLDNYKDASNVLC